MLVNDIKNGNNKILIIGIDSLSVSLSKILTDYDNDVTFFEKNSTISKNYKDTTDKSLDVLNSPEYDFNSFDYIVISKKLNPNDFETDNLIAILNKLVDKTYIISEIIYNLYPDKYFIHIIDETYRDLVYSELEHIYKENSINNIRLPSFDNAESDVELNKIDISNIEIFMVGDCNREFIKNLNFNIIGFFDLQTEDVDDRIRNLFLKQGQSSKIFINVDNEYIKEFYKSISGNNSSPEIIELSTKKMIENGYSYINDTIYCYVKDNKSYDLVENKYLATAITKFSALISFAIAINTNQVAEVVMESIKTFQGTANVIEYIAEVNGTKFINNMYAITDEILISPFETYSNIYVIFITNGRQSNFFMIKNYMENIKRVYLVDMFDCVNLSDKKKKMNIKKYKNIDEAFIEVIKDIKEDSVNYDNSEGTTVLLSPIIGDRMNTIYYKDYGIKFKKLIEDL